jgi:hypothetical protein
VRVDASGFVDRQQVVVFEKDQWFHAVSQTVARLFRRVPRSSP